MAEPTAASLRRIVVVTIRRNRWVETNIQTIASNSIRIPNQPSPALSPFREARNPTTFYPYHPRPFHSEYIVLPKHNKQKQPPTHTHIRSLHTHRHTYPCRAVTNCGLCARESSGIGLDRGH